jgi:hypothetical protein
MSKYNSSSFVNTTASAPATAAVSTCCCEVYNGLISATDEATMSLATAQYLTFLMTAVQIVPWVQGQTGIGTSVDDMENPCLVVVSVRIENDLMRQTGK